MWILRSSPASPFGRKVQIAAALCGLDDRISVETSDTVDPKDSIREQNPLGKIPALILEDGTVLYDSRVILEFLDTEAGRDAIIPAAEGRFAALTLQALADGIMDAALLIVYEGRFRTPEQRSERWVDNQASKVKRALAALELDPGPPDVAGRAQVGQIALACALGYLDLRLSGEWRSECPKLVAWLADFARRVPAFEATRTT